MSATYGNDFYDIQVGGSYQSAKVYVAHLYELFAPRAVVDVGCGRGTWLKAFAEAGAIKVVGYDGHWNSAQHMLDPRIDFRACDLNQAIARDGAEARFDLALSLEVAEHLEPAAASTFVQCLTDFSDVVMFSAAYTGQVGTNHINAQPPTYWALHFLKLGYSAFDIFRPKFWGDSRVEYWYQQNTVLYVREQGTVHAALVAQGLAPISNLAFLDCVHPQLYRSKVEFSLQEALISRVKSYFRRGTA